MNIISLTKRIARIQFSEDELKLLKSALAKICSWLDNSSFDREIHEFSRSETVVLLNTFSRLKNNNVSKEKEPLIVLIESVENKYTFDFSYRALTGLRSILNTLCNGISEAQYLKLELGFDRSLISPFLNKIGCDVIKVMAEDRIETLISKRAREIESCIQLRACEIEAKPESISLQSRCLLELRSNFIGFALSSLKKKKHVFSGIQIISKKTSNEEDVSLVSSGGECVRTSCLIRLLVYIELVLEDKVPKDDLEEFSLEIYNARFKLMFRFKIIPSAIDSTDENVKIIFGFYLATQNNLDDPIYYEIEDMSEVDDIHHFTAEIREFISGLSASKIE
jgi:hypothetical protein